MTFQGLIANMSLLKASQTPLIWFHKDNTMEKQHNPKRHGFYTGEVVQKLSAEVY